jgi:hypothetical protein
MANTEEMSESFYDLLKGFCKEPSPPNVELLYLELSFFKLPFGLYNSEAVDIRTTNYHKSIILRPQYNKILFLLCAPRTPRLLPPNASKFATLDFTRLLLIMLWEEE